MRILWDSALVCSVKGNGYVFHFAIFLILARSNRFFKGWLAECLAGWLAELAGRAGWTEHVKGLIVCLTRWSGQGLADVGLLTG